MNFYFFMKVSGASQGPFKSENPHGKDGWLLCYRYGFKGAVRDDPNRDAASAARSHEPLRVQKGWDAASPQLMHSFWNNELLKVVLEFVVADGKGKTDTVLERITLTNATIVSVDRVAGPGSDLASDATAGQGADRSPETPAFLEEIGFRFEEALHENVPKKTKATYDWKNRNK